MEGASEGGCKGGSEGAMERGRICIWIWGPILMLKGHLGWSTAASLMTLHVGWPCHVRCTPQALNRPFPAPLALGWCPSHAPLGMQGAPGSALRPHPGARSGATPLGPCPLSCRSCQQLPWLGPPHCPYMHLPLPPPPSLTQPPLQPTARASAFALAPAPVPQPLPLP